MHPLICFDMKTWKTKSGYKIIRLLGGRSNVFLLSNAGKNILIDTSPKVFWKRLEKRIKSLDIKSIDYLILTHTHYDHAANSNILKKKYKSLVFVQQNEAGYLVNGENPVISSTNTVYKLIIKCLGKSLLKMMKYEPCNYDFLVDSHYDLSGLGFNAYILHTPGHTIGSMSVIVDDEIALVGDCMFGVFKSSVYPPFAENTKELIKSWGKLLETDCKLFLPSHGNEKNRRQLIKDYNKRNKNLMNSLG